jgi:hypothetical protein
MKIFLVLTLAVLSVAACNNPEGEKTSVEIHGDTTTTTTKTYTPVDGDVRYSENKVMVMRSGNWVEADKDVEMDNNVMVFRDGRVERGDIEVRLGEGEIVTKTGEFFDNTGNTIANAWMVTKEGTKDAGRAVKKTAKRIGNKVDSAAGRDDN